jgi:hypothetical protein
MMLTIKHEAVAFSAFFSTKWLYTALLREENEIS